MEVDRRDEADFQQAKRQRLVDDQEVVEGFGAVAYDEDIGDVDEQEEQYAESGDPMQGPGNHSLATAVNTSETHALPLQTSTQNCSPTRSGRLKPETRESHAILARPRLPSEGSQGPISRGSRCRRDLSAC